MPRRPGARESTRSSLPESSVRRTSSCVTRSRQLEGLPYRQHKLALRACLAIHGGRPVEGHGPQGPQPGPKGPEGRSGGPARAARACGRLLSVFCAEHARPGHAGLSKAPVHGDAGIPVGERKRVRGSSDKRADRRGHRHPISRLRDVPWASSLGSSVTCARTAAVLAMLERRRRRVRHVRLRPVVARRRNHNSSSFSGAPTESPLNWEYPHLSGTDASRSRSDESEVSGGGRGLEALPAVVREHGRPAHRAGDSLRSTRGRVGT